MFGQELILDLYGCDVSKFNREALEEYLIELCILIDMERADLHFWDYEDYPEEKAEAPPHLDGTSCVQFITTSNITIHTLDKVGEVYINLFSCKDYDKDVATDFTVTFFDADPEQVAALSIKRGRRSKV